MGHVGTLRLLVAGVLLTGASCVVGQAKAEGDVIGRSLAHDAHVKEHWTYLGVDGPTHWGMLSPGYMACETGSHQSPIEIRMAHHGVTPQALVFDYQPAPVQLVNTGHTIQVNVRAGSVLRLNGQSYALRQFHFHAPSEHHIEGVVYAMELHLVHQNARGHVAVVAVLMQSGSEQSVVAQFWDRLPRQAGGVITDVRLNAKVLLPTSSHHYAYEGSLTTPPCTEGVRWIVLKEPIQVSPGQVEQFRNIIGDDARPTQPVKARTIAEY
ncbi:MAG: carbonic anhydrase [Nitrospiraceae bacterium]